MTFVASVPFEPGSPPARLQLWNVGDNATDYGVHRWTERSIREAFGRYLQRGNPLQMDIEHAGFIADDGSPLPVAGLCRLEIEAGAPVLAFDWSAVGVEQIATKQRRFLSPEYLVDEATGEITELLRVSLVADPGTHHARILACARRRTSRMDPMILAALKAALSAEDPKAAIEALLSELEAAGPSAPESTPDLAAASADSDADDATQAAAPEAPAAAAAPAEPEKAPYSATIAAKIREIEDAQRDALVTANAHRMPKSIAKWCSRQPLATVRSYVGSLPADAAPVADQGRYSASAPAVAKPTIGRADQSDAIRGTHVPTNSLSEAMGLVSASAETARRGDGRALILPTITPSRVREMAMTKEK